MTEHRSTPDDGFPNEELVELWKQQETPMSHTADPRQLERLAASIRDGYRTEQMRLIWLSVREGIPLAILVAYFGYLAVIDTPVMIVSLLLCLGIAVFFAGSSIRQHKSEQRFDTTLRGSIERSLSQARHRLWMYQNSGWWYFAPLVLAFALLVGWAIVDDPNGAKPSDAFVVAFMGSVFGGIYWWARRVAATKWRPEVERLEALLADLQS